MNYAYGHGYNFPKWGSKKGPRSSGASNLLLGEPNGFAVDFTYSADAKRVAVKASNVVTEYGLDSFMANSSTSPKLVTGPTGTLVWSPHNRCLQSQTLDNASWVRQASSLTANATTAPDGTATADKLIADTSASGHYTAQTITAITGTWSVYAKAGELTKLLLFDAQVLKGDGFTLSGSGSIFQVGANPQTGGATIQFVGNGWYRCSIPLAASTSARFQLLDASGNAAFNGNNADGLYLWGAQANLGPVATSYIPTTTAARNGVPIDCDPLTGFLLGMLQEPAATNFLLQATDFDNASWTKSGTTVTANAAVAPNGQTQADKLIVDTGNTVHAALQTIAATTGVFSVYAKAAEYSRLSLADVTANKADGFDLLTGTTFVSGVAGTTGGAVIRNVGNGWFRCSIPITASVQPRIYLHSTGNAASFPGDGVSGLYIWGAQAEATNTVATSFIPTTTATVTRPADNINFTPASINYSATAGSWVAEHYFKETLSSVRVVGWQPLTVTPITTSSALAMLLFDSTSVVNGGGVAWTGFVRRTAAAYASGDRAISYAGATASTDAGSTVSLLAPTSNIGIGSNAGGSPIHGYVRKVVYVPRRMTNAELKTKSS